MQKVWAGAVIVLISGALGCSSDNNSPVIPFNMIAFTALVQVTTVGEAVPTLPAVQLFDAAEEPARGVTVSWTIVSGGGQIGSATSTTNANGVATLSEWTVGTVAGSNKVSASASTLPDVVFEAVAVAGAPTAAVVFAGNSQQALTGQVLTIDPAVRVVDQFGNGAANVAVQFAVTLGNGVVVGPNQLTDESGVAAIDAWRLGAIAGENRLTASILSATLPVVNFTAQANISPKCSTTIPYILANVVVAALTDDDCLLPNEFYHDFFTTNVVGTQAIRFTMQSGALDPYLLIADIDGNILAEDDDGGGLGSLSSALTFIAGPGPLLLVPSSAVEYELGAYTFASSLVSGNATACGTIYVMRGIVSAQSLNSADCIITEGPFYADEFRIRLIAGEPVTIRMTSTAIDTWVALFAPGLIEPVAVNDDISQSNFNSEFTYIPTQTNYFAILTSSHFPEEAGAYTLEILPAAGGASGSAVGGSSPLTLQRMPRKGSLMFPGVRRR